MKSILTELKSRLDQALPSLDALPDSVWRRAGALNTWGTNAIEGNTLTHDDVQRVLLQQESVADRPVPDVIETIQHDRAFRGLLARLGRPTDLVTALELHEQVFQGSPRHNPGQWRRSNVFIAGARHRPPTWNRVVQELDAWQAAVQAGPADDLWTWLAVTHQRFEEIHPFEDGNGRIGRLLLNLALIQQAWPPLHITPEDRTDYLRALAAGNHGEHEPLAMFLQQAMVRSLLDLLDQVGDTSDRLQPLAAIASEAWCPHDAMYLALRCRQGKMAGIKTTQTGAPPALRTGPGKPAWLTSEVAVRWYVEKR